MIKGIKLTEWILRLCVFGTFIGHGVLALGIKEGWIPLITSFGFSRASATSLMPVIGIADILIGLIVLLKPIRIVLLWAIVWTFAAGLSRIVAGEPVWEMIERFAEWGSPLALLFIQGLPKTGKDLFHTRND
ncbi:MAG: DoxX-like family protein [Bacteroidia bacterium]